MSAGRSAPQLSAPDAGQTSGEIARRFREGLSGRNIPRPDPPTPSAPRMPATPEADQRLARYEALKATNPIAAANFHRDHWGEIEAGRRARDAAAAAAAPPVSLVPARQAEIVEPPQAYFDAIGAAWERDRAAREQSR